MDNGILPGTKTLVFSIYTPVKISKSYVPRMYGCTRADVPARSKNIFPPVFCRLFPQKL